MQCFTGAGGVQCFTGLGGSDVSHGWEEGRQTRSGHEKLHNSLNWAVLQMGKQIFASQWGGQHFRGEVERVQSRWNAAKPTLQALALGNTLSSLSKEMSSKPWEQDQGLN